MRAVSKQVDSSIAIDVALEQAVNSVDLLISDADFPCSGCWIFRSLQPGNEAGFVAGSDEILVAIAVHIEVFAVDEIVAFGFVNDMFGPLRRDEQSSLSATIADDVWLSVSGEVGSNGRVATFAFVDNVLLPRIVIGTGCNG